MRARKRARDYASWSRDRACILGIGHDICSITRIQNILETHADRFLSRICTEAEKAEASTRAHLATYVAGRFAAKEAVYKALNAAESIQDELA